MHQYNLQESVTAALQGFNNAEVFDRKANKRDRNGYGDFALSKEQMRVEELLPKCGFAGRYVDLIVQLGSICDWRVYHKGEPVSDDVYLERIIQNIRPMTMSQLQMKKRALRMQTVIGMYCMTISEATGRLAYDVWHPKVVAKSAISDDYIQIHRTRDNERDVAHYKPEQIRKFYNHGDYDAEAYSDLYRALDVMENYCCALEGIRAKAEQGKLFNNMLHLKLDNTEKNPYWSNPNNFDKKSGKLLINQSLEDLTQATRAAQNGEGMSRYAPYPFIWPGDVNHLKLDSPIAVEDMEALERIARSGATALPAPTAVLTANDGNENHWNNANNSRQLIQQTIKPALELLDGFFTEYAFRPQIRSHLSILQEENVWKGYNIDDLEMRSDTSAIEIKQDNSQLVLELMREGIATRQQAADACNLDDILELPSDVSEYDHWLTLRGQTPAPEVVEAEVVEDPTQPTIASQAMALLS